MDILQAVILGIVQGIAEFLPISSSGHLVVLERLFGISEPVMTFDILVHMGSLVAVLVVFRGDIAALIRKPFSKMTGLLIVGTIPAVVAGLLFKEHIATSFREGVPLACAFVITGLLLLVADRFKTGKKTDRDISFVDALMIGGMQALALPPGISRSGATITGALGCGLSRETAAKFSFLLSIIAIIGAGVLEAKDVFKSGEAITSVGVLPMLFGFLASAMVGYLAIKLLLELIKSCKLRYFSYYVFTLAGLILLDAIIMNIYF